MSSCMAVVLNGVTEVKISPFPQLASAEVATDMADEWRYAAIEAIGWDEAHRFPPAYRPSGGCVPHCQWLYR